jgi:hypothetical protein
VAPTLRLAAAEATDGVSSGGGGGGPDVAPGGVGTLSLACAGNQAVAPGDIEAATSVRSAYCGASISSYGSIGEGVEEEEVVRSSRCVVARVKRKSGKVGTPGRGAGRRGGLVGSEGDS